MKLVRILSAILLCIGLRAPAEEFSFTNVVNTTIADDNPTGLRSTIEVSGVSGIISKVTVFLEITGGFSGDFYSDLSADNGGFAVLLNRVGKTTNAPLGYSDGGLDIRLDDAALTDIHLYGGNSGNPVSGTFQPDGRNWNPQLVLDTTPRDAMLDTFDDRDPNGTWTFFIADMAGDTTSATLVKWGITMQTVVPEPSSLCLAALGGALLATMRLHQRRKSPVRR
jgi:subtilisin-like proprotein convertase family protein